MQSKSVTLDICCYVGKAKWKLYSFSYRTQEGNFVGYLHAVSDEHASYMLEELKKTALLDGEIVAAGDF